MSFVVKGGGPVNWSAITIDADKNMLGFGLSNMKEVAAAMAGGDLIAKGLGGILVRIPAGVANTVLTSAGIGLVPTWAPGGLYLARYFPANVDIIAAAAKTTVDKTATKNAALSTAYVADDGTATNLQEQRVTLASVDAENVIAAADETDNENAPIHSHFDLEMVVDGAVAEDTPAQVNETAAAKNATVNDMTLLPAAPALNDAYYFGSLIQWDNLLLNIGINGSGVWTITWEYWNGAWVALAVVTDGINNFRGGAGIKTLTFTRPGDWALTNVAAVGNMYWIRAIVSAYTSIVTQPKGTQAWARTIT